MNQEEISKAIRDGINEALPAAIQKTVNGKIDKITEKIDAHAKKHSEDMERVLPIVEAYETTKNAGQAVLWISGFIVAIGGAILMVMQFLPYIKK